jgi:hypothetical protein
VRDLRSFGHIHIAGRFVGTSDKALAEFAKALKYELEEVREAQEEVADLRKKLVAAWFCLRVILLAVAQPTMVICTNRRFGLIVLSSRNVVKFKHSPISFRTATASRMVCP